MTKHLKTDLERIERRLLTLGARVEDAVRKSIAALETRRADLALEVMGGDPEVDREEVELEEECLKVLALHQPVANDLRRVSEGASASSAATTLAARTRTRRSSRFGAIVNHISTINEACLQRA